MRYGSCPACIGVLRERDKIVRCKQDVFGRYRSPDAINYLLVNVGGGIPVTLYVTLDLWMHGIR